MMQLGKEQPGMDRLLDELANCIVVTGDEFDVTKFVGEFDRNKARQLINDFVSGHDLGHSI